MTPDQRKAKIAAAEALLNEVAADEVTAQAVATAQAQPVATTAAAQAAPVATTAAAAQPSAATPIPSNIAAIDAARAKRDTPANESAAAGKPSLFSTLMSVAKAGFTGNKTVPVK